MPSDLRFPDQPTPIAIVGPTATGKSDLAIALAKQLDGEIVNADAMQLYQGMDIGTAEVTRIQRREVAHHLLDVLEVVQPASVAAYQKHARAAIEEILRRRRTPILVGGSGLYIRAALDGLEFPGSDQTLRVRLNDELAVHGSQELHARLSRLDPAAAATILPTNGRRIVRALEVIELTGRPFSATLPKPGAARYGTTIIGIDRDTAELDARIERRVEAMLTAGFVDEVRLLDSRGLRQGPTASRAVGYQQILSALEHGVDPASTGPDIAAATRRLVRRQRSWFRRDTRINWFAADNPKLLDELLLTVTAGAGVTSPTNR